MSKRNDPVREELFSRAWRSDDPVDADAYDAYVLAGKFHKPKKRATKKKRKRKS